MECPPEPFDPALRLAYGRRYHLAAELTTDPSELGVGVVFHGKPVDGHPAEGENSPVVAVESLRDAVPFEYVLEHVQVSAQGFSALEVDAQDLPGRVVYRAMGRRLREGSAEPTLLAGVDLDELALFGPPRPAGVGVVPALSALRVRRRYPGVRENPVYLVVGGVDALPLP